MGERNVWKKKKRKKERKKLKNKVSKKVRTKKWTKKNPEGMNEKRIRKVKETNK